MNAGYFRISRCSLNSLPLSKTYSQFKFYSNITVQIFASNILQLSCYILLICAITITNEKDECYYIGSFSL